MGILAVKKVVKSFSNLDVGPFDFTLDRPGTWALTGESGVGKSTLLNMMGCLDSPSRGDIYIHGKNISNLADAQLSQIRLNSIGFIHQFFDLLPDVTAVENVMVPLWLAKSSRPRQQAEACLKRVGLASQVNQMTRDLSGGQKQRVAIARAIALDPPIILADEPTGSLDSGNSDLIVSLLIELQASKQNLLVIATHSERIAQKMSSQIHIDESGSSIVEGRL